MFFIRFTPFSFQVILGSIHWAAIFPFDNPFYNPLSLPLIFMTYILQFL